MIYAIVTNDETNEKSIFNIERFIRAIIYRGADYTTIYMENADSFTCKELPENIFDNIIEVYGDSYVK
jgi:hypothetical protein